MTLPKRNKSKFRTQYGLSIQEMVDKYGKTRQAYFGLHKLGRLGLFLSDPEKFELERYHKNDTKYLRKYGMIGNEIMSLLGTPSHLVINELDRLNLLQLCIEAVNGN